jgi:hypothetical protein
MSTLSPGQFVNNLGQQYGPDSVFPPVYLTGAVLTANAVAFPTLLFPAYNSLLVMINVTGYGGTDVVSLRFNGDSGTNYWDRTLTVAAGGVVVVDTNTVSTTLIRQGLPINKGRQVMAQIGNQLSRSKVVMVQNQFGSGAAGTAATITAGTAGEWVNTTQQITQIDCLTAGGLNILAGSSIMVYGCL